MNSQTASAKTQAKSQAKTGWSVLWIGIVLAAAILVLLFVTASINMVRVAVASQPDCVAHDRVGERNPTVAIAAKSSC